MRVAQRPRGCGSTGKNPRVNSARKSFGSAAALAVLLSCACETQAPARAAVVPLAPHPTDSFELRLEELVGDCKRPFLVRPSPAAAEYGVHSAGARTERSSESEKPAVRMLTDDERAALRGSSFDPNAPGPDGYLLARTLVFVRSLSEPELDQLQLTALLRRDWVIDRIAFHALLDRGQHDAAALALLRVASHWPPEGRDYNFAKWWSLSFGRRDDARALQAKVRLALLAALDKGHVRARELELAALVLSMPDLDHASRILRRQSLELELEGW